MCLQQEYRSEGVTEDMWRSGEALRPYFQDALQLLRKLRDIKAADPRGMPEICAPQDTDFVHFPIVDCNVADDTKVRIKIFWSRFFIYISCFHAPADVEK